MKRFILFFILLFAFLQLANSQYSYKSGINIFKEINNNPEGGIVKIHQKQDIELLFYKDVYNNRNKEKIPGYRIRIFSDLGNTAREESMNAVYKFKKQFPQIEVYRKYISPYYKVYVGDFRTRLEAKLFLNKVREYFPDSFDLPCKISLPKL